MSHVSFSKLISLNYPKLYPKPPPQPTLAEVLQSEPVKRLLSQPNIVIETIPSACVPQSSTIIHNGSSPPLDNHNKKKSHPPKETQNKSIRPEISIMPVESEINDDSRLLPAKGEGKSEIALLVVKPEKKDCGHSEPCENIICDVSVQQYIDQSGVLPMLAVGIKEDEINAPVSKHCKNKLCDALSIDHDRCRRVLIKVYRCDKTSACDVCNVVFKTRRSRMSHRNCTRKEVYRHNQTNGAEILREKMRERELQMIQAAKTKRKEYLDPATEYKKTMEMLRNNKELIIIPKSIPQPQPIITITTVSSNDQLNTPQNSFRDIGKLPPSIPLVYSQQGVVLGKRPGVDTNDVTSSKQPKIANVFCSGLTVATVPNIQTNSGQQFIKVTSVTQPNFVQPVSLNEWLVSQANIISSDKSRAIKPYLTPIKVVPITSLKSAPSLRHQTHGIPAFCLVPDSIPKSVATSRLQTIQPAPLPPPPTSKSPTPTPALEGEAETEETGIKDSKPKGQKRSQGRRKSEEKNSKNFKCPYCLKGFSTDWYFKMHVAGHTGEMLFACKTCEKPFSNRYDMKKHMLNDHNDGECRCEICGQISICKSALEIHVRSHTGERPFRCGECDSSYRSSTDLKTHQRKRHNFIDCPYCHSHFVKADLKMHLISSHMLTEDEAMYEITENQDQDQNQNQDRNQDQDQDQNLNGNDELSDNLGMEIDISDCESMSNEILMRIKAELIEAETNVTEKVEPNSNSKSKSNRNSNSNSLNSKKRKARQNGNKGRVSKPKEKVPRKANGNKNLKSIQNNVAVLKQVANNSKETETKPAVRRSSRRSNSNVQCTVCKDHFESSTLLETHLANKSKESVECQECKSPFHSQTEYKKHNMTCGKSSCKQSQKQFNESDFSLEKGIAELKEINRMMFKNSVGAESVIDKLFKTQ